MARVFTDAGAMSLAGPSDTRITNLPAFSVAMWLYRTAAPAAERALVATYNGGAGVGWAITMLATGTVQGYFTFTTIDKVRRSSTVTTLNGWMHVVATHENRGTANTDWLFYMNGKQEAGVAVQTGSGTHSSTGVGILKVGNNSGLALTAPPANIGPIAIWNRAITPAECLGLAAGMHPMRYKEGLIRQYSMLTAHGEEDFFQQDYLVQGATNPTSAFANPPIEPEPLLLMVSR